MKNTRVCPKCSSTDIAVVDGNVGPYGTGNNIMLGGTVFQAVKVNRYICGKCGFSEEWINQEDLVKIAKSNKWHR